MTTGSRDKTINFRTVAEASGVSKATLYNNAKVRTRIESLRAVKKTPVQVHDEAKRREEKEMDLKRQIEQLKEEKKMLIIQLVEKHTRILSLKDVTYLCEFFFLSVAVSIISLCIDLTWLSIPSLINRPRSRGSHPKTFCATFK